MVSVHLGIGVRSVLGLVGDPLSHMGADKTADANSLVLGGGSRIDEMNRILLAPGGGFVRRHVQILIRSSPVKRSSVQCDGGEEPMLGPASCGPKRYQRARPRR